MLFCQAVEQVGDGAQCLRIFREVRDVIEAWLRTWAGAGFQAD
jgi:hypothetical protein